MIATEVKYKKTGNEWVPEIPEHWDFRRLKNFAVIGSGQDQKGIENDNGRYSIYGTGGLMGKTNQFLYEGPSVILGRKGTIDCPFFVTEPFWTVDTAYYTKIKENVDPRFFFYCCLTIKFDYYKYGSAVPSMSQRDLNQIRLPYPPLEEQKIIADYLDEQTLKIKNFIQTKQRFIELLKEQRQSIITNAVTKGIDDGVKMKETGIDWIPSIPENWNKRRLRFLVKITTGKKNTEDRIPDGEYPFYVRSQTIERINSFSFDGEGILTAGDGVGVGKVFHYVNGKFDFHQRVYLFYDINSEIEGEFLFNYLQANMMSELMRYNSKSTVDSIRLPVIKNFLVVFPERKEQIRILEYIKTETKTLDIAISKAEREIELIKEYREAMIAEVVTGKRK
jgi:type I restriction enzyme S subunit